MFKLFHLRKSRKNAPNPFKGKAAVSIISKIRWLQGKWAAFMDKRVNPLPIRLKKAGLIVFVSLSILICVAILAQTFTQTNHETLKIGRMRKLVLQHDSNIIALPRQYERVVAFRKYMDSLFASAKGRKAFDSINVIRPGLLDSAKALEKLYHKK